MTTRITLWFTLQNIILDHYIKNCGGWVAGVKFLQETGQERAQLANALTKKNVNDLHAKLSLPSKVITHATAKSMGIQVTDTF